MKVPIGDPNMSIKVNMVKKKFHKIRKRVDVSDGTDTFDLITGSFCLPQFCLRNTAINICL